MFSGCSDDKMGLKEKKKNSGGTVPCFKVKINLSI